MEALLSYSHNSHHFNNNNQLLNTFQVPTLSSSASSSSSSNSSTISPSSLNKFSSSQKQASQSSSVSPLGQMQGSMFHPYLQTNSQSNISAAVAAAAAAAASEINPFNYQQITKQNQMADFLKILTNTTTPGGLVSSSPTPQLPSTSASNLLTPQINQGKISPNSLNGMVPPNCFMPNEDKDFYSALSSSFVGRLASNFDFFLNEYVYLALN